MTMRRLIVAVAAFGLPGCMVHQVESNPRAPIELPAHFAEPGDQGGNTEPRWWLAFDDAELHALVAQSLEKNFQVKASWARLHQASAVARSAMSGLFPTIDAQLQAGRSQSPPRVFNLGGGPQTIPGVVNDSFAASLPLRYELDVWGRVRSAWSAAQQDEAAIFADVQTGALTVAANVTERWFDIVEQRAVRALLNQQLDTNKSFLELVSVRFEQGQGALSDLYQQQQQVQQLTAQLVTVDTQEQVAQKQLALLLGKPPQDVVSNSRNALPPPPALPEVGVPARLLNERPDIRAARHRVVAADYRVGQAIAARFPSFSLSGSLGFNSVDIGSFFESFVWNFMGSVAGNVWDGGVRASEVRRTEGAVQEALYHYAQALLTGMVDVETALLQERQQRRRIAILEEQVATAKRTVEAARLRFEAGVAETYIPTLTAMVSLQTAERSLLAERRRLLSQRVQIYRALGGQWTTELRDPTIEARVNDGTKSNNHEEKQP